MSNKLLKIALVAGNKIRKEKNFAVLEKRVYLSTVSFRDGIVKIYVITIYVFGSSEG